MEWTIIMRNGNEIALGYILHKESSESAGKYIYDSNFYQNRITEKDLKDKDSTSIFDILGEGKGYWDNKDTLSEAIKVILDFNHVECPVIPKDDDIKKMTFEAAKKEFLEQNIEFLVFEEVFE